MGVGMTGAAGRQSVEGPVGVLQSHVRTAGGAAGIAPCTSAFVTGIVDGAAGAGVGTGAGAGT
jgi:hypothetical protein